MLIVGEGVFGLALVAAMTPASGEPVALPDAYSFGVCREVARLNRDTAVRHEREILGKLPQNHFRWAWEFRQEAVYASWACLVGALDEAASVDVRLRDLASLRRRIGPEAYYAGFMPPAIPDYGPWVPRVP